MTWSLFSWNFECCHLFFCYLINRHFSYDRFEFSVLWIKALKTHYFFFFQYRVRLHLKWMYLKIPVRRPICNPVYCFFFLIFQPPSWQCLLFLVKGWYLVSVAVHYTMGVFCYHSSHWLLHSCVGNWAQSPLPKTLQGQVVQGKCEIWKLKKRKDNSSCFSIISS